MNILFYNELTPNKSIEKRFDKVVNMLQAGNFKSAKVKKMTGTEFYRAELNEADRLLLQIKKCHGEKYIHLLEIIYHHKYNKSRFLRGAEIDESKFEPINSPDEIDEDQTQELTFINPKSTKFYLQDKPISFDDDQANIYEHNLPLIITGPAGSGKTIVMLEKIKTLPGRVLYVTRSKPLADNTRRLYQQHGFENPDQTVDFLSYAEFQAAINPPSGKELQFDDFAKWLRPNMAACPIKDIQAMYEEFFGVITGATINSEYLSEEEYIKLGVRQSLIEIDDREAVYALFRKLLEYMQENGFCHSNMHAFNSLGKCTPHYDYVVVDEVQDITNIQLALILKSLITPNCFMLGGDSHQIVHPSSFSWSNLKTMLQRFHADYPLGDIAINILPNNYRNSQAINEIANKLLRIKNVRFGSIDRESCYLSNGQSITPGKVELLSADNKTIKEINDKTAQSTQFAVVVIHDAHKELAYKRFETPLIFTVQEIKGLEYDNIILYKFISSEEEAFDEIAGYISPEDLAGDLTYARLKDKEDKDLEIYKFYINGLITAATRGINNLYILEKKLDHYIFELLEINSVETPINIQKQQSTQAEWDNEAAKLKQHGNIEQAQAIQGMIRTPSMPPATDVKSIAMPEGGDVVDNKDVAYQDVPWEILTRESLPVLLKQGLCSDQYNKKSKKQLHDYSLAYNLHGIKHNLLAYKYPFAGKEEEAQRHFERTYQQMYSPSQKSRLNKATELYGVNFRNEVNHTPLMIACKTGNGTLAAELLDMGANPFLADSTGRMAFHHLWQFGENTESKNINSFKDVYHLLKPESINLKIRDQEFTLEHQQIEFFIFNYIFAVISERVSFDGQIPMKYMEEAPYAAVPNTKGADFTAGGIYVALKDLSDSIIPEHWKQKKYISKIISKNCTDKKGRPEQDLFVKVSRGYYIINPLLEMQYNHEWINFYDLFHFLHLQDVSGDFNRLLPAQILIQHLKSSRRDTSDIDYKFWMNGVFHWFIIIHSDSADRSIRRAWDKNPAKDIIEQFFTEIDVT